VTLDEAVVARLTGAVERAVRGASEENATAVARVSPAPDTPDGKSKPQVVVDRGIRYERESHPLLFKVVDYLDDNPDERGWTVRQIADKVGVSKSWCAVAKRFWSSGRKGAD